MTDDLKPKKRKPRKGDFKKGNTFWKLKSSYGPKPKFASPDDLLAAAYEYFEKVSSTPLQAAELVKSGTKAKVKYTPKMRIMTIEGLCVFLDVSMSTWYRWKEKGSELREACLKIDQTMSAYSMEGAAAGMLNHAIVATKLGLAKKVELAGNDGGPIEIAPTQKLHELLERLAPEDEGATQGELGD